MNEILSSFDDKYSCNFIDKRKDKNNKCMKINKVNLFKREKPKYY
jgi:hypothetical protein